MIALPRRILRQATALGQPIIGIYALLILANLTVWAWAVLVFRDQPVLLGTAFLAYGFGLRHAVDADHIAAIDNVTRKLMQEGKRPVGVGLFFALGHSSVVILAAAGVAATATALAGSFDRFKAVGSVVGTGVSALFLFAIADRQPGHPARRLADLPACAQGRPLCRRRFRSAAQQPRPARALVPPAVPAHRRELAHVSTRLPVRARVRHRDRGGVARAFRRPRPPKVSSIWAIMVFPALFAAGMSLIDTTDGILMLGAYDWAFIKPIRKLFYNLTITLASVVVAVLIGSIETLGLVGDQLALKGAFWDGVDALNGNLTALGVAVIGLFIAAWIGSVIVYRYNNLDETPVTYAER